MKQGSQPRMSADSEDQRFVIRQSKAIASEELQVANEDAIRTKQLQPGAAVEYIHSLLLHQLKKAIAVTQLGPHLQYDL